ncbi:MAG: hydroxymethylglutaryl-CoA synthase family protein [Chloroflexi bacterium]|nr:MAG: hydroxymethylglutaryl-CoA synthase family protein [Chloroflexota bacterium]
MTGILRYGAYLPAFRLDRGDIGAALGTSAGRGRRTVACYDEDTTSLGVEAARRAMSGNGRKPATLHFATTLPAYADKTNATAIHAALALDSDCFAGDMVGAVRGGFGAIRAAAQSSGLAVLSDIRTGLPGSADERTGGDAATAFLFGDGDSVIAELLATASSTAEFLDRWRAPGELASHVWEERFGVEMYLPLVTETVIRALAAAGVEQADHVVVSSPHLRAARAAVARFPSETVAGGLDGEVGNSGAADVGLQLADVLDRARPNQTILVVLAADGCDVAVLRTTGALPGNRPALSVRDQVGAGQPVSYGSYLTWRGLLPREPPRRPDPRPPSPPASARSHAWKFGLVGCRCRRCETAHLPPTRVCVRCGAVDEMSPERFADRRGRVATCTVDRLTFSMAPPVIAAIVDFDEGGRLACEVADARPDDIRIGTRVEMTFRRLHTADGIHNYFWKARPVEDH